LAKILQQKIFSWKDVESIGELERLKLVIEVMPDNELMKELEAERKGRRDDYPIRAVWNSILAGIVYQHNKIDNIIYDYKGTVYCHLTRLFILYYT
jgi:hypothetical protein